MSTSPLTDYTLDIPAPANGYALKWEVYRHLSDAGVVTEPRGFLYGVCPLTRTVMIRGTGLDAISSDSRPVLQPEVGGCYDFCLRASPMIQKYSDTEKFKLPADPGSWLRDRLESIGIDLLVMHYRAGQLSCTTNKTQFQVPDVIYVGRLFVADAEKLTAVLASGIGRHKAFGFGLLQLFEVEE